MTELDPNNTTLGDLCRSALREAGVVGVGQEPLAEDVQGAWARLQWMLQQWERKRFLVFHLVTLNVTATGALSYTVGPQGQINTGASSVRPARLESAFLRQLQNSQPNQVDYPLELLQSMEDYNRIRLKSLVSFPSYAFYDPAWPLGNLFAWPVPQASIYGVFITILEQLPISFATLASKFVLPFEYYSAMLYNLALRLRSRYQIPSFPGDPLPGLAKDSLNVLRGANLAIARLTFPPELGRDGIYNIFSDTYY